MAKIDITQVRSRIGSTKTQKKNLDALGLRKMGRTVTHEDSPVIKGMIERVRHLVIVTPSKGEKAPKAAPKKAAPVAEGCEVVEMVAEKAPEAKVAAKPAAAKAAKTASATKAGAAAKEAPAKKSVKPETKKEDESK